MAMGNLTMQRALNERRAALGMPIRNSEDADPDRSQPSTATDYFDNMFHPNHRFRTKTFIAMNLKGNNKNTRKPSSRKKSSQSNVDESRQLECNLKHGHKIVYNKVDLVMSQLLKVSVVAIEEELSGDIGREIIKAIKERSKMRFGSRRKVQ
ncbi:hypothetical protein F2Q68_00006375 [Brassica cretica]|uniref:Uncharacterized protein n=1 Tax=Brassica cretica TaxID=69181 RepID=A0A8S9JCT7_BRACR|nr:hypothetical protein F2Q68_00006375 [Brassica cretica]